MLCCSLRVHKEKLQLVPWVVEAVEELLSEAVDVGWEDDDLRTQQDMVSFLEVAEEPLGWGALYPSLCMIPPGAVKPNSAQSLGVSWSATCNCYPSFKLEGNFVVWHLFSLNLCDVATSCFLWCSTIKHPLVTTIRCVENCLFTIRNYGLLPIHIISKR